MSGWTIATIVLGCLLLFSIIAIIDTGIDAKWKTDNYIAVFLFIFLFPIALPFAIWNWIRSQRKEKEGWARANYSVSPKMALMIDYCII